MSKSVSSKTALGHAFGTVIVAGIVSTTAGPATAAPFTPEQCKIISAVAVDVLKAIGPDTVSAEFKQSFRDFLGSGLTCNGPKEIETPTANDIGAFNTIRSVLLNAGISLQEGGLRAVTVK
jgi:hypothetical protein